MPFRSSRVAGAGSGSRPHRLQSYFFGLFGPHGALPMHLTEYAREREQQENDPTFRSFADVFHHRLLLLFYRAWANARPANGMDRAEPRRIDTYVGSMIGLGAPEFRDRDSVADNAKLYMAGRLALQTRPVEGLLAVLNEYLRLPVTAREFVGEWARLSPEDHCRLGIAGSASVLGRDAVLGRAVWNCQHKFRLICGPLSIEDFRRLLPGRSSLVRLRDMVRGYVGFALDWDLNLVLAGDEVPSLKLGVSGQLGWTTWLGQRKTSADADDIVIRPNAAELRLDERAGESAGPG